MAVITLADSPVPYCILHNPGPTLDGDNLGWRAGMSFGVDYADMRAFSEFAGGLPYTVDGQTRYIPLSHPDMPTLLCKRIRAQGVGWTEEAVPTWRKATVACEFQSVPFGIDGSTPFMVIRTRGAGETYTIAGTGYRFPSDGLPIQQDAGINIAVVNYLVTIYLMPTLNDTVFKTLAGKINDDAFLGFDAGYLRFDTWEAEVQMTATFATSYTVTLAFSWRAVPWNQFLRPDGLWEAPQRVIDSGYAYEEGDFTLMTA